MKDIEPETLAGEIKGYVGETVEPLSNEVGELRERLDDIAKQPAPLDGKDGADGQDGAKGDTGEKGVDGLGLNIPTWGEGVYREGSIVQAHFGQAFKALVDTAKGVDSDDWERVGTQGFRLTGSHSVDKDYQPGDLFIKDFGLFLHDGSEAKLIAGRGPEGKKGKQGPAGKDAKDGKDGQDGKDGSQIEAMEIKDTSLVLVVKNADGEVKSFDTDLAPFLEASVEITKSLQDTHTKQQAEEVETRVKNLWNHLNEHLTDQQAVPVRFFRGLWTPSVAYQSGDMVKYANALYVAKQSSSAVMPHGQLAKEINSGDYWVQLISQGGGGGGGGDVELSDYVKRPGPSLRNGKYLAYRELGAAKSWAAITTDMVETNSTIVFRDKTGRFKSAKELPTLGNQLEVNRFLWDEIEKLQSQKPPEAPEGRLPIYAEDEPTEYPYAEDGEPNDLEADDQWYQVEDPDFDYDNPDPEGLDLHIWTETTPDTFEWVLFVADIPDGAVIIKDEAPDQEEDQVGNGSLWFDNSQDTMQLYVWHADSDAWIPVAPPTTLEGRVSTGEATQQAIIAQIQKSLDDQEKIVAKIEELSITKGAVARYTVKGTEINVATRNGELYVNSPNAVDVVYISFAPFDANGQATKPANPDDIIEFVEAVGSKNAGEITRFKVISGDYNALTVEYLSGTNNFEVDEAEEVYVYPQNQAGASQEYVDQGLLSKLNNSGANQLPDDTDWKIRQHTSEGKNKTLLHGVGGQLGVYNLKEPVESHHAATKAYVDAKSNAGDGVSASRPPGLKFMCSIVNLPNGYFQWWVKESTGNQHLELATTDRDGIAWGTNTPREDVRYSHNVPFTIWEVSGGGWKMKVTGTISRIDFHPDHALCYVSSNTALNGGNFANGSGPYYITISGIC